MPNSGITNSMLQNPSLTVNPSNCQLLKTERTGFGLTMRKLVLSGHIDEVVDTTETNIRHI